GREGGGGGGTRSWARSPVRSPRPGHGRAVPPGAGPPGCGKAAGNPRPGGAARRPPPRRVLDRGDASGGHARGIPAADARRRGPRDREHTPRTRAARGKIRVDVAAIDAVAARVLTPASDVDVYLVDEIGRMECLSAVFASAVRALLSSDRARGGERCAPGRRPHRRGQASRGRAAV